MTPLFSNKTQIFLAKNDEIISEDGNVGNNFNNFFENATKSLKIEENSYILSDAADLPDPINYQNYLKN